MDLIIHATTILGRAKADYIRKLHQVDSLLQSAVARDPSNITEAEALQATYTDGITPATLVGAEQP